MRIFLRPVRLVVAITLAVAALPAVAQTHIEVQGGRSYMDSYATNAAFIEAVFQPRQIGDSRFFWSPDVSLGYINGRDVPRYRNDKYTTRDNIKLFAAGARFHLGGEDDWYRPLFFSVQAAAVDGRTQALSSGYEFVSTLGWQWRHVSFQLRHISNASLHEPNRGETMALIGIGFDL